MAHKTVYVSVYLKNRYDSLVKLRKDAIKDGSRINWVYEETYETDPKNRARMGNPNGPVTRTMVGIIHINEYGDCLYETYILGRVTKRSMIDKSGKVIRTATPSDLSKFKRLG